jgi:hypothetical protein
VIAALGPDTVTTRTATEPNGPTGVLFEDEDVDTSAAPKTLQTENNTSSTTPADKSTSAQKPYRLQIRWRNVFLLGYLHLAALYGLYLTLTSAKLLTTIFCEFGCFWILNLTQLFMVLIVSAFFLYQAGGLGITAGAHRLWSHRSYKAKWPLKVILVIFNTLAFQVSPCIHLPKIKGYETQSKVYQGGFYVSP